MLCRMRYKYNVYLSLSFIEGIMLSSVLLCHTAYYIRTKFTLALLNGSRHGDIVGLYLIKRKQIADYFQVQKREILSVCNGPHF